jgi:polar amino acid transport system substrate-binding protein
VLVGKVYDAAPYGIAISKKNSGLTKAIQKALQDMMDDGSYAKITAKWELSGGNISTAKINGALT